MFRDLVGENGGWLLSAFAVIAGVLTFLQFGWWGVLALAVVVLVLLVVSLALYAKKLRSLALRHTEPPTTDEMETAGKDLFPLEENGKTLDEAEGVPPVPAKQRVEETEEGEPPGEPPQEVDEDPAATALLAAYEGDLNGVRESAARWVGEAASDSERLERQAQALVWESRAGSTEAVDKLRQLCDQHPDSYEPVAALATVLQQLGEPLQAANELINRAESLDDDSAGRSVAQASSLLREAGDVARSLKVVSSFLEDKTGSPKVEASLRTELAYALDEEQRSLEALAHLERAVALDPTDRDRRWDLAHRYLRAQYKEAAAFLYEALALEPKLSAATLNNLGVALKGLGLRFQAVNYYKRAANEGNGRSAGNLAFICIEAGLAEEAETWIEKGRETDSQDERLAAAIAALAEQNTQEAEALEEIHDRAARIRQTIAEFSLPTDGLPVGRWTFSTDEEFDLSVQENGSVRGEGGGARSKLILTITSSSCLLSFTWREGPLKTTVREGVGILRDGTVKGVYRKDGKVYPFTALTSEGNPIEDTGGSGTD